MDEIEAPGCSDFELFCGVNRVGSFATRVDWCASIAEEASKLILILTLRWQVDQRHTTRLVFCPGSMPLFQRTTGQ